MVVQASALSMNPMTEELLLFGRKREADHLEKVLQSVLKDNEAAVVVETAVAASTEDPANRSSVSSPVIDWKHRWNCQLVLVCGAASSGKRTFARSVLQRNLGRGSQYMFVSGRFHPSQHQVQSGNAVNEKTSVVNDRPFSAIDEAVQEIIDVIMDNSEMKTSFVENLQQILKGPDDMEILTNAYPSMKRWMQAASYPQAPERTPLKDPTTSYALMTTLVLRPPLFGSQLVAQQSQVRSPVLIRFLEAVVSIVPLVLLLEDLQCADEASLILVEALMNLNERRSTVSDKESKGLLIVATLRTNEKWPDSNVLRTFLEHCQEKRVLSDSNLSVSYTDDATECRPVTGVAPNRCFHEIHLSDLTWDDVFEWVQLAQDETFQLCSKQQQRDVSDLAFHYSNGNLLRLRYYLFLLGHDVSILREDVVNETSVPMSTTELYAAILLLQNATLQSVVRTAAALALFGEKYVRCDILEVAMEAPCLDTVILAHNCGLLEYLPGQKYVQFSHRDLLLAAYAGIPSSQRALVHLDIGRRIWRSAIEGKKDACNADQRIGKVVLATLQLRNSIHLIVDLNERLYMAQLCFEAGQESSLSGGFYPASKLFEFALCVLSDALWRPDLYETSLVLHNAAAQAYYSIGDFNNMEITLDLIFDHATSFRDKLSAYIIQVYSFGTRLKLPEAFRTACFVLRELGEPVNENPGTLTIIRHLTGTKAVLHGKSDSFFRNLLTADDADFNVLSQLLTFAMFQAYVINAEAGLLLCCRIIRLSMKNGVTGPFLSALASYGFLLCATSNFAEGNRYGQLSLELVQKFEEWRPRVLMTVYGYIYYWIHPFRDCLKPLQEAQHAAFMFGDLGTYAGSTIYYLLVQLCIGSSLKILEPSARSFCCSLDKFGQENPLLFALPIWEFISDLLGGGEPLAVSGEIKDSDTALKYAVKEDNKYVVGSFYMLRTMWHYLVGDYSIALAMARKSAELRKVCDHNLTFYEALALLAMAGTSSRFGRRKYRNRGRMLTKRMKGWARQCPSNFLNKQLLLDAENAALGRNSKLALSLFERSIHKAKEEGFCHEEGIAYERLGHYQLSQGQTSNAIMSFECARVAFDQWGASTLVNRIDMIIASL